MHLPKTLRRRHASIAAVTAVVLALTACSDSTDKASSSSGGGGQAVGANDPVSVALITKDSVNPFWIAMQNGAKEAAAKEKDVTITIAAGKEDGDEDGQVQAIENSIARGDQGILITPNGPGVNPAIKKARDAGMFVIALDTPPVPADTVDITFATDNRKAGQLIGKWAAGQLDGKKAIIAQLPAFTDKIISVDIDRNQGFLEGMGIDVKDKGKNNDEAPDGKYTGGKGGDYTLVCSEPTTGATDGGKTAMETCLSKNPDINLVYTINEPAGGGAKSALKAAGNDAVIVSVDGGCQGVADVQNGNFGATSQQYPLQMAKLGVEAIVKIARGGEKPKVTEGLSFYDTGVALVTDKPVDGVPSIDTAEGAKLCWGSKS